MISFTSPWTLAIIMVVFSLFIVFYFWLESYILDIKHELESYRRMANSRYSPWKVVLKNELASEDQARRPVVFEPTLTARGLEHLARSMTAQTGLLNLLLRDVMDRPVVLEHRSQLQRIYTINNEAYLASVELTALFSSGGHVDAVRIPLSSRSLMALELANMMTTEVIAASVNFGLPGEVAFQVTNDPDKTHLRHLSQVLKRRESQ